MGDLAALIDFDKTVENVGQYHHDLRTVFKPDSSIPWPVFFCLARFNPKHCFLKSMPPKRSDLLKRLIVFESKVQWSWVHRQSPPLSGERLFKPEAPPCSKRVDPSLTQWLQVLRSVVIKTYEHGVKSKSFVGNTP